MFSRILVLLTFYYFTIIILAAFVFFKLLADYPTFTYRDYSYHILRLCGNFIKGSIDNSDFEEIVRSPNTRSVTKRSLLI